MTRHVITLSMRPPRWHVRLWYRRLGLAAPAATGSTGPRSADWVRLLVPYRFRRVHHWYAEMHRFYWLPCRMCGIEYGGHEGGGTVPGGDSDWVICSRCTRRDGAG